MFVYRAGTNTLVGQSAGGTAEEIGERSHAAGSYDIYVGAVRQPGGGPGAFRRDHAHRSWSRPRRPASPPRPATQSVTTSASTATVTAGWSGLDRRVPSYLGVIDFGDGTNAIGSTIVSVTS